MERFEQLKNEEEEIEAEQSRRENPTRDFHKKKQKASDFVGKKNHTLSMESYIQAEIFLKHYEERLEQLRHEYHVAFKQFGRNILIATS